MGKGHNERVSRQRLERQFLNDPFEKLCGLMEGVLSLQNVTVRAPVPLRMRAAIVLAKVTLESPIQKKWLPLHLHTTCYRHMLCTAQFL